MSVSIHEILVPTAERFLGSLDKILDKAAEFANDKTGGGHESQIQSGEDKAESYLGVEDQDQNQQ